MKLVTKEGKPIGTMSHPARVRGLKQLLIYGKH